MAEAVESGKEDGLPVVSSPSSVESSVVTIEVAERQEKESADIKEEVQIVEVRREKIARQLAETGLRFPSLQGDCCPEVTGIFLACLFPWNSVLLEARDPF